jgi:dolichol-phosphate mannosyltransferase
VSVVVVLPTYNERENIERVARDILARPVRPRLLVVDDGSPDGTAEIVTQLGEEFPGRVTLLSRTVKSGLGRAYGAGFEAALADPTTDVVVQMDADGSHDPADIDRLVAALDDADLALGSRYVAGGSVKGWSKSREVLSRGGNIYARLMLRTPLRDLTGGFKAWRAGLLTTLDAASTASDGYAFQIEMTMRAARTGARIVEVPITFAERVAGTSKMSSRIAIEALLGVPAMRKDLPAERRFKHRDDDGAARRA